MADDQLPNPGRNKDSAKNTVPENAAASAENSSEDAQKKLQNQATKKCFRDGREELCQEIEEDSSSAEESLTPAQKLRKKIDDERKEERKRKQKAQEYVLKKIEEARNKEKKIKEELPAKEAEARKKYEAELLKIAEKNKKLKEELDKLYKDKAPKVTPPKELPKKQEKNNTESVSPAEAIIAGIKKYSKWEKRSWAPNIVVDWWAKEDLKEKKQFENMPPEVQESILNIINTFMTTYHSLTPDKKEKFITDVETLLRGIEALAKPEKNKLTREELISLKNLSVFGIDFIYLLKNSYGKDRFKKIIKNLQITPAEQTNTAEEKPSNKKLKEQLIISDTNQIKNLIIKSLDVIGQGDPKITELRKNILKLQTNELTKIVAPLLSFCIMTHGMIINLSEEEKKFRNSVALYLRQDISSTEKITELTDILTKEELSQIVSFYSDEVIAQQ